MIGYLSIADLPYVRGVCRRGLVLLDARRSGQGSPRYWCCTWRGALAGVDATSVQEGKFWLERRFGDRG